jgi:hypothetical protein
MHSTSTFAKLVESADNTATFIYTNGKRLKIDVGTGRILKGADNALLEAGNRGVVQT